MLYWLAVLKGKAHTLAEDTVVNTPTPSPRAISWSRRSGFRLEQRECEGKLRSYTLLEAETLIIVNHMVRLAGLRFSPGRPCGPPAEKRAREALYWPTDALLARGRAAVKTYFGGVDLCKNVCSSALDGKFFFASGGAARRGARE